MKTTLCIAAFFLARIALAGPVPTEFGGVKWGASVDEVKTTLQGSGAKVVGKYTKGDKLAFSGGSFAGSSVEFSEFICPGGKFSKGMVRLQPDGPLEDQFEKYRKALSEKYGLPQEKEVSTYRKPKHIDGVGFVNRDTKKPPQSATWTATDPILRRTVVIKCYIDRGRCVLEYTVTDPASGEAGAVDRSGL